MIIASGNPKYSCTNRRPVAYACPVVPTSVTALICVAITDRPTAHHGRDRFARKDPSTLSVPFERRRPSYTIHVRYAPTTSQSIEDMSAESYELCMIQCVPSVQNSGSVRPLGGSGGRLPSTPLSAAPSEVE